MFYLLLRMMLGMEKKVQRNFMPHIRLCVQLKTDDRYCDLEMQDGVVGLMLSVKYDSF